MTCSKESQVGFELCVARTRAPPFNPNHNALLKSNQVIFLLEQLPVRCSSHIRFQHVDICQFWESIYLVALGITACKSLCYSCECLFGPNSQISLLCITRRLEVTFTWTDTHAGFGWFPKQRTLLEDILTWLVYCMFSSFVFVNIVIFFSFDMI